MLVKKTILSGIKHGIPVSLCGELANDTNFTAFFLTCGVRAFSVGGVHALSLKKHIRGIDSLKGAGFLGGLEECGSLADAEEFIGRIKRVCSELGVQL
jgi:phosphotransferase system enzyme I (PtsI)